MENNVDRYEDALGTYLVKLSGKELSTGDSRSMSVLLHCIGDFERISDHAVNIMNSANEIHREKLEFSPKAVEEIEVFASAVRDIVGEAVDAFMKNDLEKARDIENR